MLIIFLINLAVVTLTVMVHYEMLYHLSLLMPKLTVRYRFRIAIGLLGSLLAHIVEVWIFAFVYYLMIRSDGDYGTLLGGDGSLMDAAYFSFITYTTLGYGDLAPIGAIRYLAGLEALTGLVLITWTASFMFFEMQKYWKVQ